jgi:hypothetical protein
MAAASLCPLYAAGGLATEDIIHSLLAHEPPSISEEVQLADRRKELQRRIKG